MVDNLDLSTFFKEYATKHLELEKIRQRSVIEDEDFILEERSKRFRKNQWEFILSVGDEFNKLSDVRKFDFSVVSFAEDYRQEWEDIFRKNWKIRETFFGEFQNELVWFLELLFLQEEDGKEYWSVRTLTVSDRLLEILNNYSDNYSLFSSDFIKSFKLNYEVLKSDPNAYSSSEINKISDVFDYLCKDVMDSGTFMHLCFLKVLSLRIGAYNRYRVHMKMGRVPKKGNIEKQILIIEENIKKFLDTRIKLSASNCATNVTEEKLKKKEEINIESIKSLVMEQMHKEFSDLEEILNSFKNVFEIEEMDC